jgi:glyoxylase-like metal-dependent hydrolase (beta-lactamase superfamily II)
MNAHSRSWIRACITAGFLATGLSTSHAVEVNFQPVAKDVYAHIGDLEGRSFDNEGLNANIGLVVTPSGAVLIDSGASFQSARQIAEAVRKVTPQPIKWVINTGTQDHRWLGNGYFASQGAELIAHANALADMKARAPEQMNALRPVLKDRLDGTVPTLPTRWLTTPDTRLEFGGVVIEVKHRRGGHTPGDSLVWLPGRNVLFSGDVVYVDRVLGMNAVSKTRTWLDSFEVIEDLRPEVIVPGHGEVTTLIKARTDTRDLLRALRQHAGRAVEAGTDIGTAVKSFNAAPFAGLKHADVWIPQLVNRTYLEMELE